MDIVDSTLKALNKTIDDVKNDAVKLEQLTIQRINGYKDDIDFNLTDELIKTISNEEKFKRITFDDLILLYNKVTDSKLLFGVYFDITKEYLGENYERIRK